MRVAIIENMAGTPHGQIGVALREAAADIHVIRAYAGDPLPEDADDHDALVVLGGEQNAVDDVLYPYLPDLALLMKAFGDAGKAVMGVCLGSQLLARAYGGENILSGPPEFGWQDVSLTPEGYPIRFWPGSSRPSRPFSGIVTLLRFRPMPRALRPMPRHKTRPFVSDARPMAPSSISRLPPRLSTNGVGDFRVPSKECRPAG